LDNVAHTLVGAALSDLASGPRASKAARRVCMGAGVIAANLPDFDLVYSGLTAQPLGYLLHHRGHTHTVLGLAVLAAMLAVAYGVLPSVRRMRSNERVRLWLLIATALASHLLLDALNSYGVHPFHPVNSTWYYGDALFIFEPWLWVILGIAVVQNARTRFARVAASLPILVFPITMASMGMIPPESAVLLLVVGGSFGWLLRQGSARTRAGIAISACVAVTVGMFALSRIARGVALTSLQSEARGRLIDVILTPNPSSPLCWSVIGIDVDGGAGEYVYLRGTLSLMPEWKPPTSCASHLFAAGGNIRLAGGGRLALRDEIHQPLALLQDRARRDCWVREWLRFGRAPVLTDEAIFDLRFAERAEQNFTHLPLGRTSEHQQCPQFVPGWAMPRADLLVSYTRPPAGSPTMSR
jgi:inner membrane protein